jgi:ATP-dependent Clp protease adaptor protein ClpS
MIERDTEIDLDIESIASNGFNYEIILYNDDVNTFEYVIDMLVKVCKHSVEQAEQCSYIVHYSGKCSVKSGTIDKLKPICLNLMDAGLTAEIK